MTLLKNEERIFSMLNPMCGKAVAKIMNFMPDKPSVIEFGSQTLGFKIKEDPLIATAQGFYKKLGFDAYEALDFNDEGTQKLDLNKILEGPQADLVTNNGTGEHIFNQAAVFTNAHNFCKPGGIMLHILPWINWQNHGFYNFHPILFIDMAEANGYEILQMYAGDRDGNIIMEDIPDGEIKKPEPTDKNVMLVVALRKVSQNPFVFPVQGKYSQTTTKQSQWKGILIGSMQELTVKPFVHCVGELPKDAYEALEEAWPEKDVILNGREGDNILYMYQAHQSLMENKLPPIWRDFVEYHTSKPFFDELIKWAGIHIFSKSPHLHNYPDTAGVRYRDKTSVQMEAQFCIDTPATTKKSVKEMHVDNPLEFYKFLLRFPGNGYAKNGELELGKWKKKPKFFTGDVHKNLSKKGSYDVIATVPNKGIVFFLNDVNALHAVTQRKSRQYRRYFNIVGETLEPSFEVK